METIVDVAPAAMVKGAEGFAYWTPVELTSRI